MYLPGHYKQWIGFLLERSVTLECFFSYYIEIREVVQTHFALEKANDCNDGYYFVRSIHTPKSKGILSKTIYISRQYNNDRVQDMLSFHLNLLISLFN